MLKKIFMPVLVLFTVTIGCDLEGYVENITGDGCIPEGFSYNSSTQQGAYFFLNVAIDATTISSNDWVGAFNGEVCVGARKWDTTQCGNGVCEVPVLGQDSQLTQGYMLPGVIPTFKIFRASIDLIQSERLSSVLSKNTTAFTSYFDRRWWRENDIFILASDLDKESPSPANYYDPYDLVRVGNGQDSFGILRTFYVAGYEQSYRLKHLLFEKKSTLEIGARIYWERFIDDKKQGDSPNSRDGIYFIPASSEDDSPTIVGQSHHYETMAFSGFLTESIEFGSFDAVSYTHLTLPTNREV